MDNHEYVFYSPLSRSLADHFSVRLVPNRRSGRDVDPILGYRPIVGKLGRIKVQVDSIRFYTTPYSWFAVRVPLTIPVVQLLTTLLQLRILQRHI